MAHDSGRDGVGRKSSSVTSRTREVVAKASFEGISPLEVMKAMRMHAEEDLWDQAAVFAAIRSRRQAPCGSSFERRGRTRG
jgi:hypothetical protein